MTRLTNDHEIMIGSTTRRLQLIRDEKGKAAYSVIENPPETKVRVMFGQNNWTAGHGQYKARVPSMYFDGASIDTTQEGRIILGPYINEVKTSETADQSYSTGVDSYGTIYGSYIRAQTFTAGSTYTMTYAKLYLKRIGTPGTVSVDIKATTFDGSDYVPSGSSLGTSTKDGNTISTSAGWVTFNFFFGVPLTSGAVYAIIVSALSGSGVSYIDWGQDVTSAGYAGGKALLSLNLGVTWALDGSVGATVDDYFEVGTSAASELDSYPTCFVWSATLGKLLCATGGKVYTYTGVGWDDATTTLAGVTDLEEFNGVLYAAMGASTKYYYSTDGASWTQTDLTDGYAVKFLSAPNPEGTSNVLWKTKTPNEVSNTTDGRTIGTTGVQWTSPAYIGDTSNNITNIFLDSDRLMVGRTDNLYHYDSDGGISALMDDLKQSRSTDNFKYVINWKGDTVFSLGTGLGIIESGTSFKKFGPLYDTGDIDKVGQVVGLSADTDYLYVAMLEGTNTVIYKGRKVTEDFDGDGYSEEEWAWCPWVNLSTNYCGQIFVAQHSATDRRLWFGYGTHTGYVYISDNPTADANARFASSGYIRLSYTYGSSPYWDKMIQYIITETAGCTANITVTPKYRKDTDTSDSALTAAITTNGTVKTNLTSAISGKKIQFELWLATNDATITPQVLLFEAHGFEKPETIRIHEATYSLSDTPELKGSTIRSFLRGGRTSTSLIKFADLRWGEYTSGTAGTNYQYVIMEPGYPKEIEIYREKDSAPEPAITVRWVETNFS